ncbi:MAG: aldehyde dehydrogenase [Candidatus Marinimicrobia bacterium]|nr:aldehyde dehydrogenase [Candidatus Neomarinimicrobiota bacterium]
MTNQNYINGKWCEAASKERFDVINPFTEKVIETVPRSGGEDVETAVASSQEAWEEWRFLPGGDMRDLLREVAIKSREHGEELAKIMTAEVGKPLIENSDEVEWIASCFEYYSELGRDQIGRVVAPMQEKQMSIVVHEPYGVVGCIVPWNYPLLLAAWKMAPALAAGNTCVIKPSELTPLSILRWVETCFDHFPSGVVNVVTGYGAEAGESMVTSAGTNVIAFTGSVETGTHIAILAAEQLKKTHFELGGNDALIVCADVDVEIAARGAFWAATLNCGQVCTSSERIYVEEEVSGDFIDAVVAQAEQAELGDPMGSTTDIGPMASAEQREKIEAKITGAKEQGAKLITGGKRPKQFERGYFFEPTVLSDMSSSMEMMRTESFGPVVPIQTVSSFDEAVRLANESQYGLGCSLYTNDLEKAFTAAREIKAGSFWINDPLTDNEAAPFGGMRKSGGGRELGIEGLNEFREAKHILIDYQVRRKDYWFPYDLEKGRKT